MNANIKNDNGFHMKLFHEIIIAQKFHITDKHVFIGIQQQQGKDQGKN